MTHAGRRRDPAAPVTGRPLGVRGKQVLIDDRSSADSPEWLFAVQAQGDSTYDAATGRLSMPAGTVQAFTDRPYRDTQTVTPQSFVNLFHRDGPDSFAEDPPNAVLTYWDDSSGTPTPRTVVCEASGGAGVTDDGLWVGLKILEPAGATLPARGVARVPAPEHGDQHGHR